MYSPIRLPKGWAALAPLLALTCLVGCGDPDADAAPAAGAVPLYDDLGTYHYAISSSVPEAQGYFDQGLRLTYAFNHAEAIRAYEEGARRDPECAICYWGVALANGPNINAPMDSAAGVAAYAALQEAIARQENASESERALIDALATRYAAVPPADRAALDQAYSAAMRTVADRYPDDLDIQTLYAESVMDLSPWNYWTPEGQPRAGTEDVLNRLETVLAAEPNHPGACHYYIHLVEAVQPEKAVACAERLAALMPGAGHLVHMPAHIYIRVGRWADAIEANQHAVHADQTFIQDQRPGGLYPMFYYPHNNHFLSLAARMSGQKALAIESGRLASRDIDPAVAAAVIDGELIIPTPSLTLLTFGDWEAVLQEPLPAANLPHARALGHYAQGVAHARLGHAAEAKAASDSVAAVASSSTNEIGRTVLQIAAHALLGEIAAAANDNNGAITHFRAAADAEDSLPYTEPPYWYHPVRHRLGELLQAAGRPAEAEVVYREDLARFPENGWSLRGLATALQAQGKAAEATATQQRYEQAWASSDVR